MSIRIEEVKTKKQKRLFIDMPYVVGVGDNPNFVPPLFGDEMKILNGKTDYAKDSDSVFYIAYKGNKPVGRISGIVQSAYNKAHNEKTARFTRFDCIDDLEVAKALFEAAESWARAQGMNIIVGPLDYSDMEREGLLIEGFDQMSTFEEQYHPEYYKKLVEACGYEKDVDYLEFRLYPPKERSDRIQRIANVALRMNKLHEAPLLPIKQYAKKYYKGFFGLMNVCYAHLYGTVEFDEESALATLNQFSSILDSRFVPIILDQNDNVVAAAIAFPGLNEAIKPSKGRLTLPALLRIRKAVKNPKTADLGLIAVHPDYQKKGVNAVFLAKMMGFFDIGVKWLETNLNLETNEDVMSQWKAFDAVNHKRRRVYKKVL
ncbi:MAG: N-acetyltransferase [Bacilli bacterium]|nr:N-acetyltransferase [Bacilli bacterium]